MIIGERVKDWNLEIMILNVFVLLKILKPVKID